MEQNAYTVTEFCRSFRISRTKLYEYWVENLGPDYYRVGNQRRISAKAARAWQDKLESASNDMPSSAARAAG